MRERLSRNRSQLYSELVDVRKVNDTTSLEITSKLTSNADAG